MSSETKEQLRERLAKAEAELSRLKADIDRRERAQSVFFRISEAAVDITDSEALFRRVHEIIGEILPAENFFIAIYRREADEVSFPLWINEVAPDAPQPRPVGKSLTDYILLTGKSLLLTDAEVDKFREKTGHFPAAYGRCRAWLGSPLLISGRPAGVISMQDYGDPDAYGPADVRLLGFVAEQVAAALARFEYETARRLTDARQRESQEYFARSFFSNPAAMTLARPSDGTLIEVNSAFLASSGYTRKEVIGRSTLELGMWVQPEMRNDFLARLQRDGYVRDFEVLIRAKDGHVSSMLLTADVIEMNGHPCLLSVGLDITERRRRERVQEATYQISRLILTGGDLTALFAELHRVIGTLMPARNFYVALLNPDRSLLSFPYYVDQNATAPAPRRPARGFTEYVLAARQPLLTTAGQADGVMHEGKRYAPLGKPAALWLGAPLLIGDRAIGVIVVQDYDNPRAFGEEEKRLLMFVADQTALAVDRRRSEEVRRESEEHFSKSFNASPAIMAVVSLEDNRIIAANDAFLRTSGYGREEVLGRTSIELGIWPEPARRVAFIEKLRSTGAVRDFEAIFYTKSRDPRYVSISADIIELRRKPCMLITAIDLTERHRREKVQLATYEISRAVLAGGSLEGLFAELHRIIGGLMRARNFYVGLLSPGGNRIDFPYFTDEHFPDRPTAQPSRPPGLGFTEYVIESNESVLILHEELNRTLRSRGDYRPPKYAPIVRLGAPLRIAGRAIGVISVHDYRDANAFGEEEKRLLAFVADQAALAVQRRQAADALERAEHQYRGIFENALEGLYVSSPDGRFLRANPAMARILGYENPEALIAAINDVGRQLYTDPARRAQFLELVRNADTVPDFDSEVLRADGSRIRLCESVRVVRNASGEISHFEGVAIDVTATHERARALREARDAADAANRAKSQFLASMSHELRTPLNGILGYTQILRRDSALTERQRGGVAIIHNSAEHLLALINDVLDLARIEARKLELNPVEFDLHEFIRCTDEFFAPRAREKNLLLEATGAPGLPRIVYGDVQRLRQIIFNLLSNAVKFTRQGGVVFTVDRTAGGFRFSVSDTGPGIAREDLPRLFEPFAQLGDAQQRATGTGLGLNVSRSIVEQMGGQLHVESRPGWGTRFWFVADMPPRDSGPVGNGDPAVRRIVGYRGDRIRVLAADDHGANRQLLRDLLEPLGFTVDAAIDGQQAVEKTCATRPRLVIMDLRMPRLDGLAATREIRRKLGADSPCIIAVSASAQEQQRQASLESGCVAFLAKPIREEDLFTVISRHLGIQWEYADQDGPSTSSPFPVLPQPPAPEDADALFDLASKGDVIGVRNFVQKLAERDPRMAPFARNVHDLAARFRMKAIRQFVDRYRTPEHKHADAPNN